MFDFGYCKVTDDFGFFIGDTVILVDLRTLFYAFLVRCPLGGVEGVLNTPNYRFGSSSIETLPVYLNDY